MAAYKGQATNLMGNGAILMAALQIHSVEARHAAEIRLVNGKRPWTGAFDGAAEQGSGIVKGQTLHRLDVSKWAEHAPPILLSGKV